MLSIDGGGARGLLPGTVLQCVEEDEKFSFGQSVDYFAAASVGTIFASAFAQEAPQSASQINQLFRQNVEKIFYKPGVIHSLWALFHTEYGAQALQNVLQQQFGDLKFTDLKKPVYTLSIDYTTSLPFHFDSSDKSKWPKGLSVVETIRSATAAATYFPPYEVTSEGKSVLLGDGGLYDNNPTLSAFLHYKLLNRRKIAVLSVGTGLPEQTMTYAEAKNMGELKWVESGSLINNIFNATSQQAHIDMQNLADGSEGRVSYLRIQEYKLPKNMAPINNGSPEAMAYYQEKGQKLYEANKEALHEFVRSITK